MDLYIDNNMGKFRISRPLILEGKHEVLLQVFSNIIPVRAEYLFPSDEIEYMAFSHLFKPCPRGNIPPDYQIICTEVRNDDGEITEYKIDAKEIP